jgi:Tannase and feruloyl esterase
VVKNSASVWVALVLAAPVSQAAMPECSSAAVKAAAPTDMTIGDISNLGAKGLPKTQDGVVAVPPNALGDGAPEFCLVTGTVVTNPKSGKTANFAAELPAKVQWNGKFLFEGCGGNCGKTLGRNLPDVLRRGYPVFATDGGHGGAPVKANASLYGDDSWAVTSPGHVNEDAINDFYYRATHTVTKLGKELTRRFYAAQALRYAYFDGCSDGGRDGMVELAHYPEDFDGVIAGDPYFDVAGEVVSSVVSVQVQLRSPHSALTAAQLSRIDEILTKVCDAADGVVDELIQNPAGCDFDPQKDLPKCKLGASGADCFTREEIESLSVMLSAITDPSGKVVYPGYPSSDLNDAGPTVDNLAFWVGFRGSPDQLQGPEPWTQKPMGQPIAWSYGASSLRYILYADQPGFNALRTPGISFSPGKGEVTAFHAVIPDDTAVHVKLMSAAGNGNDPSAAARFLQQGRKLIMFHGLADGDITPYSTIRYYRALAALHGGYAATQKNARLFLVPGMAHCGGGPGPNVFGQTHVIRGTAERDGDVLTALENWVERHKAPGHIVATKYDKDDPKAPVQRTMPLCPFPAMARYKGSGNLVDQANWSCAPDDHRLLKVGAAGREAGL